MAAISTKRRPLFAELLRAVGAVEGIGRVRFTSPHPKDLRPETIEAMAETPEVCEQLHLPCNQAVTTSACDAARATRRGAISRPAAARAAIDDLAVTTDIIWASRARAAKISSGRSRSAPRPPTTVRSPSSSRPDPVHGQPTWRRPCRSRRHRGTLRAVEDGDRPVRRPATRLCGWCEEVLVEGVSRRDEAMLAGCTRQGKLIHFAAVGAASPARRTGPGHRDGRASPSPLRPARGGDGAARYRVRIPVASA